MYEYTSELKLRRDKSAFVKPSVHSALYFALSLFLKDHPSFYCSTSIPAVMLSLARAH